MNKKYVIIGASAAGIACANRLRQLDKESEIICISDEIESPYNKCLLADYMAGTKEQKEIYTLTLDQAQQKNITLMLGQKVVDVKSTVKQIVLNDGSTINYDALLIAVGTSPRMPQIPHAQGLKNLFTFHRLCDIQSILTGVKENKYKKAIVIGSGLSGLECADALQQQGVAVTVVELQQRILSTHIDAQASLFIQDRMKQHSIEFIAKCSVESFDTINECIQKVHVSDGSILEADLFIFAIGLQPNLELPLKAGVATQELGIITDDYMQTSIVDIYAAGDIALVRDQLTGMLVPSRTWPDAMLQGLITAHAMVGQAKKYPGIAAVISSAFFGIKFASCGPVAFPPQSYEQVINEQPDFYHSFLLENDYLKGFLLVSNTGAVGKLRQLLLTKTPVTKELLLSL